MKFFILSISLLCSLAMVEGLLRIFFNYFVQNYNIEMWRYSALMKQGQENGRSHVHVKKSSAKIMGVQVKINSKGLRDDELSYEKKNGEYRILLLGDSITFGFGAKRGEIFADILENYFNRGDSLLGKIDIVRVINGGVGNYNSEQELAFLFTEGIRYGPDEVILCFYINDLEARQEFLSNIFTRNFISYAYLTSVLGYFFNFYLPGKNYLSYYKSWYTNKNLKNFEQLMRKTKKKLKERGILFRVVIIPELHGLKNYPFTSETVKVKKILTQLKIDHIDTYSYFNKKLTVSSYWVAMDDVHPNYLAHKVIAKAVWGNFYEKGGK